MRRFCPIRLALFLPVLLVTLFPLLTVVSLVAQDDPNETPLGDVARDLRKKAAVSHQVIDDDNLDQVMKQAESRHTQGSALRYLMDAGDKGFQVSAPDVTCSLSFTANVKSLLSSQYAQMDLPAADLLKLEGPAAIEGDAITVSVFNGTSWHVSELAVALTIVRRAAEASLPDDSTKYVPALAVMQESEVRPEKKPDVTVIYRMRAAAAPRSTTVFSAPLNQDIAPGEEWHWAIVQAKGYPPQSDTSSAMPTSAPANSSTSGDSVLSSAQRNSSSASLGLTPQ